MRCLDSDPRPMIAEADLGFASLHGTARQTAITVTQSQRTLTAQKLACGGGGLRRCALVSLKTLNGGAVAATRQPSRSFSDYQHHQFCPTIIVFRPPAGQWT